MTNTPEQRKEQRKALRERATEQSRHREALSYKLRMAVGTHRSTRKLLGNVIFECLRNTLKGYPEVYQALNAAHHPIYTRLRGEVAAVVRFCERLEEAPSENCGEEVQARLAFRSHDAQSKAETEADRIGLGRGADKPNLAKLTYTPNPHPTRRRTVVVAGEPTKDMTELQTVLDSLREIRSAMPDIVRAEIERFTAPPEKP